MKKQIVAFILLMGTMVISQPSPAIQLSTSGSLDPLTKKAGLPESYELWPTSVAKLVKKIESINPDMRFKKGRPIAKWSTFIANAKGKSSILIYANGDKLKYLDYMIILDFGNPAFKDRLKQLNAFMVQVWGEERAKWVAGQIQQVAKDSTRSVKRKMPDKAIKLEFEYESSKKAAHLVFNEVLKTK